jgi:ElaB/YqjD/DUF883 family membrane-anchored ribosome-binding protein
MNALREARLRRELNNVADQVQNLIDKLGDEGSARLETLRGRLSSVASDIGAGARDRLDALPGAVRDMQASARQAAKVTDAYVRDNPWRVIGLGALAGLLIGYLATRRW